MGGLAIRIISLFGRYSVLLLVPPVALAVWAWLPLLDDPQWLTIVLGLPIVVVLLATVVLVLGMLIAGIPRPKGTTVDRSEAPELWSYWDSASPAGRFVRRQIVVDGEINAAMAERSRFAGLFGRDQTLTLGLGLLILLDRPAVEAVLEHEFAHAELKHSAGLTRIGEFHMTYESFEGYAADDLPIVDLFLDAVCTSFAGWLGKVYLDRSKMHEVQADRQSAAKVGVESEARSQILLEGSAHIAKTMIFDPLEKEIIGALAAPRPPLDRILERRAELTDLDNIRKAIEEVLQEEADPDATHPPLEERLAAIGARPDIAIAPVGLPAFETMMPEETRHRLLRELNREWTKAVDEHVRLI